MHGSSLPRPLPLSDASESSHDPPVSADLGGGVSFCMDFTLCQSSSGSVSYDHDCSADNIVAWIDSAGDSCTSYDANTHWCQDADVHDNWGYNASLMCCACGGGNSSNNNIRPSDLLVPFTSNATMLCKSNVSSAPACEVVFLSLDPQSTFTITIEIANTDFQSSNEYVSAVIVGGQTIGGSYLTTGGEDNNCAKMSRILDAVAVPAGVVSMDGTLTVRIETSSNVNYYPCADGSDGSFLSAKVTINQHSSSSPVAFDCQDNMTFDAGYGSCDTYGFAGANEGYCYWDEACDACSCSCADECSSPYGGYGGYYGGYGGYGGSNGELNYPPFFNLLTNIIHVFSGPSPSASQHQVLANISKGTPDEDVSQQLSFVVADTTNGHLFLQLPTISANGSIAFVIAPEVTGDSNVSFFAVDDGGVADGGEEISEMDHLMIRILESPCTDTTVVPLSVSGKVVCVPSDLAPSSSIQHCSLPTWNHVKLHLLSGDYVTGFPFPLLISLEAAHTQQSIVTMRLLLLSLAHICVRAEGSQKHEPYADHVKSMCGH